MEGPSPSGGRYADSFVLLKPSVNETKDRHPLKTIDEQTCAVSESDHIMGLEPIKALLSLLATRLSSRQSASAKIAAIRASSSRGQIQTESGHDRNRIGTSDLAAATFPASCSIHGDGHVGVNSMLHSLLYLRSEIKQEP